MAYLLHWMSPLKKFSLRNCKNIFRTSQMKFNKSTKAKDEKDYPLLKYILNEPSPLHVPRTAKYKRSISYQFMNVRCTNILDKLISIFNKEKKTILNCFGQGAKDDLNSAIEEILTLKYSIETGAQLTYFKDVDLDVNRWNFDLTMKEKTYGTLTYYTSDLLFAECYMYRKLREIFNRKKQLFTFDPFGFQKASLLHTSLKPISNVIKMLVCKRYLDASHVMAMMEIKSVLETLLKNSLWSNRVDLSLSEGSTDVKYHLLDEMHTLDGFILEDDTEKVFSHLVLSSSDNKIVDIVMDNSGYELLSDLCLADFMVVKCSVKGVNFRVKRMPWFVSDVTPLDFSQAVYLMANHSDSDFKRVGVRWQNYLTSGVWKVYDDVFWTLGLSYGHMPEADPVLYDRLKQSHLILFKGDLNYRKLIQDYVWDPTVSFSVSLGQFRPAPLLAIRTCKSDTVTGLKHGVAESAETKSKDWLISGEYAVVQFYTPL